MKERKERTKKKEIVDKATFATVSSILTTPGQMKTEHSFVSYDFF